MAVFFNKRQMLFEPVQPLSAGGMARLTLVQQPDGTRLVLRELHPRLCWDLRMQWRFYRGVKIREKVSPHPNIVYSVDFGYRGFIPYEIIEYVPGVNLHELINKKDDLIKKNSLLLLRHISTAIAHIHAKGYIHLDIKAENIVIDSNSGENDFRVKLTDFDLSRKAYSCFDRYHSGTASYMAPEQLRQGAIGIEADIFAFGVLSYYLVTGTKPFTGYTREEMRRQQMSTTYQINEPIKINPDLTPKLNKIIMECLEKDPTKRYPNMAFLQKEIGNL